MRSIITSIMCALVGALSLSCGGLPGSRDAGDDGAKPGDGLARIAIPAISGAFLEMAASDGGQARSLPEYPARSRAFIAVTGARLELREAGVADPIEVLEVDRRALVSDLGGGGTYILAWNIAAGTGYTIEVTLFNGANGSDPSRCVTARGSSSTFSIIEGSPTYISVTCQPVDPIALARNELSAAIMLEPYKGSWKYPADIVVGGERWYTFTATSKSTLLHAIAVEESEAIPTLFVYEADGVTPVAPLWRCMGVNPGDGSSLSLATVQGACYLVGAVDLAAFERQYVYPERSADLQADRGFRLVFRDAETDSFEDDDTRATARPIAEGSLERHSIFPEGDVDWFVFPATKDETFTFSTGTVDGTNLTTTVALFDQTGAMIYPEGKEGMSGTIFAALENWTCPATGDYTVMVGGQGRAIGQYGALLRREVPPADLEIAVAPAAEDTHHGFLVAWDEVAGAERYQIWLSTVYNYDKYEYLGDPVPLFEPGGEALPSAVAGGTGRASFTTPARWAPGQTLAVQVSWLSKGGWSRLSLPARGTTEPETTIQVGLQ